MQGSSEADIPRIGVAKRVSQLSSSTEFYVEPELEALQVLADRFQAIYIESNVLKGFLEKELQAPGNDRALTRP